jgi:hypothetical protein
MGRKSWRLSRAFRVLLACLALWLPAQSADASFALTDAVVMCAARPGGGPRAGSVDEPRGARRSAALARRSPRHVAPDHTGLAIAVPPTAAPHRAVAPPLYLLHCALLC